MTYRILSYNIQRGGRGREVQLAAVVNDCQADLVVLQESRDPEVVRRLAADTGMAQWAARGGESLGFMSRTPLESYAWHKPRISRHAFLEIHPAGTQARIFGVHLSAVHAAWTEQRRIVELRALLRSIALHQEGVHVLTGDFNTLAPGELLDFKKLPTRLRALVWLSGGKVRWRTIQVVLDGGYVDAYRATHGDAPGFTFPTWDPHVRLDYLFIPARHRQRLVSCDIVDSPAARAASDHLPLLSVVELPVGQHAAGAGSQEPADLEADVHP